MAVKWVNDDMLMLALLTVTHIVQPMNFHRPGLRQYHLRRLGAPLDCEIGALLPWEHAAVHICAADGRPFTVGTGSQWFTELVLHLKKQGGQPMLQLDTVEDFCRNRAHLGKVRATGPTITLTEAEIDRRTAIANQEIAGKPYLLAERDCELVVSRILHDDKRHGQVAATVGVAIVIGLLLAS